MNTRNWKSALLISLVAIWFGFYLEGCRGSGGGGNNNYSNQNYNYNYNYSQYTPVTPQNTATNTTTTTTTTTNTTATPTATSSPATSNTVATTQTVTTTAASNICTLNVYLSTLLNDPADKNLQLYIPGYAYFQGVVYSNGNIRAMGPIRVIGGVICKNDDPANEKQIILEKGAMLTTNPEYLKRKLSPPALRLKISKWEEKPTSIKEAE